MRNFTDKVTTNFEDSALYKFLGTVEAEDFKRQVKDAFIERIVDDLREYHYFLISEEDVVGIVASIAEDVKKEVLEEYGAELKKAMKDTVLKSILGGIAND